MLSTIQKLMFAFVTLIIGLVLIGSIATSTQAVTSETGVNGEVINIAPTLNTITESEVNFTHGTLWTDAPGMRGTHLFPTISQQQYANATRDLACTMPVITNESGGAIISSPGNWSWATESQAKGRCGIIINATSYPRAGFNSSYWNFTYTATWKQVDKSIPLSIANVPTGWKAQSCPIPTIVLTNGTTTLISVTDYTYSAGIINLISSLNNNWSSGNSYLTSYSYCADGYVSGWGGTVLTLVPGFFALAILIFSVGMFYSLAKDAGIV